MTVYIYIYMRNTTFYRLTLPVSYYQNVHKAIISFRSRYILQWILLHAMVSLIFRWFLYNMWCLWFIKRKEDTKFILVDFDFPSWDVLAVAWGCVFLLKWWWEPSGWKESLIATWKFTLMTPKGGGVQGGSMELENKVPSNEMISWLVWVTFEQDELHLDRFYHERLYS